MKEDMLRVRMDADEKRIVQELARDYELSVSDFVRNAMSFLRTARPPLVIEDGNTRMTIMPKGKE